MSRFCRMFLVAIAAIAFSTGARAIAIVHQIDAPLPAEFRERAAALLKEVRPSDSEEALRNTKALWWSGRAAGEIIIIMRVELGCYVNNCMTLIGRMTGQSIKLDLTLEVGRAVLATDFGHSLWGSPSAPPLIFEIGDGVGLAAVFREQGWVVTACANCMDWGERNSVPTMPPLSPRPEPRTERFEDFRSALGALKQN